MTARAVTMSLSMSDDVRPIMDEPVESLSDSPLREPIPAEPIVAEETVDGLPVLAEVRTIERASGVALPAVQAAAAAATGFVAGAATIALVRRRSARKLARTQRAVPRRPVDMLPVIGSRTFLVDVHLLAKPGE